MSLIAIATSAVKVGQKIFSGIQKRKEKRIEKKSTALNDQRSELAKASDFFGSKGNPLQTFINPTAGGMALSDAAENLSNLKGGAIDPQQRQQSASASPSINPMFLILGGAVLLILFFKKG